MQFKQQSKNVIENPPPIGYNLHLRPDDIIVSARNYH